LLLPALLAGYIMLAFLGLYIIEGGYFTGLLFISKAIRGENFSSE
jgi:hypothetical protein